MVSHILDVIQHDSCLCITMDPVTSVDDLTQFFLVTQEIDFQGIRIVFTIFNVPQILRDLLVENETPNSGFNQFSAFIIFTCVHPYFYSGMQTNHVCLVRHEHFGHIGKYLAVTLFCIGISSSLFLSRVRQVITSQDHVLCWRRDRRAVFWCQDVVNGKHQESCFCLCFY